jgi:hypothetical protein
MDVELRPLRHARALAEEDNFARAARSLRLAARVAAPRPMRVAPSRDAKSRLLPAVPAAH